AEIDAPLDEVWELVEDVEKAPDWQGGLKDLEALERDAEGRATLVESASDAKVRTIKSTVRFAYDGPTRLSWPQVKGDVKSAEPVTPAVPDAPVSPAVPDPGHPAAPEEPAEVPAPEEPPTPAVPEPGPDEN